MLIASKLFPALAREVRRNYVWMSDPELCTGCAGLRREVPVGAIGMEEDVAGLSPRFFMEQ